MTLRATISRATLCDDIALLQFEAPAEAANVLSQASLQELERNLDVLEADRKISAVVIASSDPNQFLDGPDLRELMALQQAAPSRIDAFVRQGQTVLRQLSRSRLATLAVIHGTCLSGGAELAAWCDGRLMSDGPRTGIGFNQVALGLLPMWGGTAILPRLVGLQRATNWMTAGSLVPAAVAAAAGFAEPLVSQRSGVPDAALSWLRRQIQSGDYLVARKARRMRLDVPAEHRDAVIQRGWPPLNQVPRGQRPAVRAILQLLEKAVPLDLDEACEAEIQYLLRLFGQLPSRALVNVAALADEIQRDRGVDVANRASRLVRRVGILGAGTMGVGIAAVNLQHDVPVVLQDASHDALARGLASLSQAGSSALPDSARDELAEEHLPTARAANSDTDFAGCDLIIESIVENKDVKQRVLQRLCPHLSADTVLASNTSTIPITQLAECVTRPERFCGIHFCNPVHRMPLVEVVCGKQTSEATIRSVVDYAKQIGKLPIVVNDCPGFLINRLLLLYMNEALTLYCEGVSLEQIERAAVSFGMECGPFELFDVIGVDTAMYGGKILWEAFPARISLTPILPAMVKRGWLGQKQGRGFYRYGTDGKRGDVDPELQRVLEAYVRPTRPYDDQQILDRLLLAVLVEATRVLEEGIVRDVRDIDAGLVFGLGFPHCCGGLLFWADQVGAGRLVEMLKPWESLGTRMQPTTLLLGMAESGRRFYETGEIAACDV